MVTVHQTNHHKHPSHCKHPSHDCRLHTVILLMASCFLSSCMPEQRCYRSEDCTEGMICTDIGECAYRCSVDAECGTGFVCRNHDCVLKEAPNPKPDPDTPTKHFVCPEGMVSIRDAYCMDSYEASRPDATSSSEGKDESKAVSQKNVLPWRIGDNNAAAEAACQAAGKRLCTPAEWELSCRGMHETVYGYGDSYDPYICNGLDTFPYPGFHVLPTGTMPDCTNGWGVYDLSGNLWEHTADGSAKTVRGGAFNCVDSENNHRCSYIPMTWTPLALGFRCCADGAYVEEDASPEPTDEQPHARLLPVDSSAFEFSETDAAVWHGGREVLLAWDDAPASAMSDAPRFHASAEPSDASSPDSNAPAALIDRVRSLGTGVQAQDTAIQWLKQGVRDYPENADLRRMLGIAYARKGNHVWALRTLAPLAQANPEDCQTIAWIAWIRTVMAMPDEAAAAIAGAECRDSAYRGRLQLLESYAALTAENTDDASDHLYAAMESPTLAESDARAANALSSALGLASDPNLSWSAQINLGYASNAVSGSPNDPALYGKVMSSEFLDGEARLSLDPLRHARFRPAIEGQLNGRYLFSDDAKDLSYLDLTLRVGASAAFSALKLGLWYSPETLIIHGGDKYNDGPLMFYISHRAEIDIELWKWLYIFGGYGKRFFRQKVRTRHEFDIGAGAHHAIVSGLGVSWGMTYRQWISDGNMYDLYGVNASLAFDYRLPVGMEFRLGASVSYDGYPSSLGYFDAQHARRETAAKGNFQVWTPSWAGLRAGVQFKASRRWSSANDYDFEDYRALISLKWSGGVHFYTPNSRPDDDYPIPWNLESPQSSERIRDIIRQDEDMQRSSSCLQN